MDICGDNRFEIIARAKEHLLDATNIDTSPKEMEVLDNFLFRCWQMGWLERYNHECEDCLHFGDKQVCGRCRYYSTYADRKTEPTISKMEQVEDEPQTVLEAVLERQTDEDRRKMEESIRKAIKDEQSGKE